MWDLRMKENGGCLQRISGSPGDILYAASTSSSGNIAVGGADRTVTIYDPRRLVGNYFWFLIRSESSFLDAFGNWPLTS